MTSSRAVLQYFKASTMSTTTRFASRLLRRNPALLRCSHITCRRVPLSSVVLPTRLFSTTLLRNATLASQLQGEPTVTLFTPSAKFLEEEELDVELIPPEDVKLVITDRAAEVHKNIYLS